MLAFLLGAGASRELGMPIRAELNAELLGWLNPASLRKINDSWRARGYGYSDDIIAHVVEALDAPDFDYENLLARWEDRFAATGDASYHRLYAWLAQVVSQALFRRQVSNRQVYVDGFPYFSGLAALARQHTPLWIFSLNHDVVVECLAAHFGLPIACGFSQRTITLPCRKAPGDIVATMQAHVLSEAELAEAALPFFPSGTPGINLLKIRGALDIFALDNTHDLIKLAPRSADFDAIIDVLQIANEGLLDNLLAPDPLSITNQIPWIDEQGNRRVLRRTLMASETQLTDPYPHLMQRRFLEYFRIHLGSVERLVAIGYGMGQDDVNEVLQDWLAGAPLLDRTGQLVGVVVAQRDDEITQLPAVPLDQIRAFLGGELPAEIFDLPRHDPQSVGPLVYDLHAQRFGSELLLTGSLGSRSLLLNHLRHLP